MTDTAEDAQDPGWDVLVVDGANVVGSRPDGWWRDRPVAAARLHARLVAADLPGVVVLVLEGSARPGVPAGRTATTAGSVTVAHARGSGDDRIVDESVAASTTARVAVVTADRGLVSRVEQAGARSLRPSWLLARLERTAVTPGDLPDGP